MRIQIRWQFYEAVEYSLQISPVLLGLGPMPENGNFRWFYLKSLFC